MKPLQSNVLIFSVKGSVLGTKIQESLANTRAVVEYTYSVQKATEFIAEENPCLIVIDTPSDDVKAIELCKKIKKTKEDMKMNVYFLVDNNQNLSEQLEWFDLGVDEFGTRDTNSTLIFCSSFVFLIFLQSSIALTSSDGVSITIKQGFSSAINSEAF